MEAANRRLAAVLRHAGAAGESAAGPEPSAAGSGLQALDARPASLLSDAQVQEFIRSGWMSIGPDQIGLSPDHVEKIYEDGCAWHDGGGTSHDDLNSAMPGLQDVCRSPAVHGALRSLLGQGYMLHPHGGFHPKPAGSGGQTFHKYGPRGPVMELTFAHLLTSGVRAETGSSLVAATASAITAPSICSSSFIRRRRRS